MSKPKSIEQMVRDLLEQAIKDRLVAPNYRAWHDPDPQCRSSGELIGTANLLRDFLKGSRKPKFVTQPKARRPTERKLPVFYVESYANWFLVHAANEKLARREGRKEYGGHLSGVRLATASEIAYYKSVKGSINECD